MFPDFRNFSSPPPRHDNQKNESPVPKNMGPVLLIVSLETKYEGVDLEKPIYIDAVTLFVENNLPGLRPELALCCIITSKA